MNEYQLIIPGRPVSWKRPGQNGNRRYDTQKLDKEKIRWLCKEQAIPMFKAVEITMFFFFYKKDANSVIMTKKPDLDNLAKLVLDAFTGVIYKDDSVVYNLELRKYYTINQSETQIFLRGKFL